MTTRITYTELHAELIHTQIQISRIQHRIVNQAIVFERKETHRRTMKAIHHTSWVVIGAVLVIIHIFPDLVNSTAPLIGIEIGDRFFRL